MAPRDSASTHMLFHYVLFCTTSRILFFDLFEHASVSRRRPNCSICMYTTVVHLIEFLLRDCTHFPFVVKQDRPRARCALIQCQNAFHAPNIYAIILEGNHEIHETHLRHENKPICTGGMRRRRIGVRCHPWLALRSSAKQGCHLTPKSCSIPLHLEIRQRWPYRWRGVGSS